MSSPITPDEIAALAMTLAACTPMEKLTNMEVRAALELLKQRGFLRRPPEDHPEPEMRSPAAANGRASRNPIVISNNRTNEFASKLQTAPVALQKF